MKDRPPEAPEPQHRYTATAQHDRAVAAVEPILVPIWPEGAKLVGVGRSLMFELVASGQIATVKCGRKRLVEPAELRAFAKRLAAA
ncbi:MAG: hypothetical protein WKF86_11715 [Acidimicrobiales bacterium]